MAALAARDEAIDVAFERWPNAGVPGELSQVLPRPQHFAQAAELVTREAFARRVLAGSVFATTRFRPCQARRAS